MGKTPKGGVGGQGPVAHGLIMFADDTVIFSESKKGLQAGLDGLWSYCKKWGVKVNASKTK